MARSNVIRMRKEINLLHASTIMTGVIIGSGIFVSPASFIINTGSVAMSLFMWVFSGLLCLCIALCFNELAGMFPKSGGEYTFFREIIGTVPGFLHAWQHLVMIQSSFQALLALTTVDYLVQSIFQDHCQLPQFATRIFAIWTIVTMVVLNSVYVKHVTRVQTVLTSIKVISLVGIAIIGLMQLTAGRTEILSQGFQGTSSSFGAHAIAVHSGIFTYMGWQYIFCLMEEIKNPERIVPQATIISMLIVTVLYTLTNVAYFTVMTPEEMMSSKAVALTFAEKTIGKFSKVVPFFVACSTIGSLNGAILGGSRYYFAAARDNLFPSLMSALQIKYLTPWVSLFSVTIIAAVYVITGEALALIEYIGFGATAMLFIATYCVLYLRWKKPNIRRPIKIPLAIPVVCFFILGGLVFLGVYQAPYSNGIAVLLVATGIPVYYIFVVWASKQKKWMTKMRRINSFMQKLLLVVPPDKDNMM